MLYVHVLYTAKKRKQIKETKYSYSVTRADWQKSADSTQNQYQYYQGTSQKLYCSETDFLDMQESNDTAPTFFFNFFISFFDSLVLVSSAAAVRKQPYFICHWLAKHLLVRNAN